MSYYELRRLRRTHERDTTYWRRGWDVDALGRIEEFDGSKDSDWQQYVERMEYFFAANGITDATKKRAVFLSVIGACTYKTLRNILSPAKPGEKEYSELVDKLSKHFRPAPSEIVERFKFHSRSRKPGESVATFVAELRSYAEFCNFGDTLEAMIRDRLVCGINDTAMQKRRNTSNSPWLSDILYNDLFSCYGDLFSCYFAK